MRGPTSTQGMRFSADARRLRCPGGHAGDFARCLAPLPPSGFRARILLDAGVFFVARTGPPGRAVHFREFSASRGDCIRAGIVFLSQRDPSAGDLGWLTASGAAITRVSRRAVPQNDANRAASTIRGTACGGRDAENSGFCTVQAGVRWDEKGCPRLFMHGISEIMQDNRAPCAGYPAWARHTPTLRTSISRTSSRSKYLPSNKLIRLFSVPMGSGVVFYLPGIT